MTARRDRRERIARNAETRRLRHHMNQQRAPYRLRPKRDGGWYADRQGRDIDLARWSVLFEDRRYRFVAHTRVSPSCFVSTIWEGMVGIRPAPFATMVFRNDQGGEEYYDRTEGEACTRHLEVCIELYTSLLRAVVQANPDVQAMLDEVPDA